VSEQFLNGTSDLCSDKFILLLWKVTAGNCLLLQKGEFIPPCVGVGEKVLLPEYGGTKINFDDKVLLTFLSSEVI